MVIRERKAVDFELESADESGEFSGYAAVFGNLDDGNDIIERGAFAKTIAENFSRIKILSQHNECELPIGKPLELREDERGLFIRGKISDTQKGRDIQTLLRDGVLTEMSIGYEAVDFEFDGETGVRHLKEVRLWEISIVTWGMNELAQIDSVKSLTEALKAKGGKISRARLAALKPYLAVFRELLDVIDTLPDPPDPSPQEDHPATQDNVKSRGLVIEIIPKKKAGGKKL